jgi:hypothetical protein
VGDSDIRGEVRVGLFDVGTDPLGKFVALREGVEQSDKEEGRDEERWTNLVLLREALLVIGRVSVT